MFKNFFFFNFESEKMVCFLFSIRKLLKTYFKKKNKKSIFFHISDILMLSINKSLKKKFQSCH